MRSRSTIPLILTLLLPLFALLLTTAFQMTDTASHAQEPVPVPPANGTELPPREQELQRQFDLSRTLEADLNSRIPTNYLIAYLIGENAAVNDKSFSEETIVRLTSAQVFYTWDDFVAAHEVQPVDILISHESLADTIDREWAYRAYRDEVIFMGLNVTIGNIAEIVGSPCFKDKPLPDSIPDDWDWINMFGYSVQVEDPQYRDTVKQTLIEECHSEIDTNETGFKAYYRTITMPLIGPNDVDIIPKLVATYTRMYDKPNRSENR